MRIKRVSLTNQGTIRDNQEEILRANTRLDEAEVRTEKIQNKEVVMTEMLKLVKLENKLIDLESRSRHENVRIYWVPEDVEKESPTMVTFVENLL